MLNRLPSPPVLPGERPGLVALLGQRVVVLCHDVGGLAWLAGLLVAGVARGRVDVRETLRHLDRFAVQVLPLVLSASVIVGGVVAMQGLGYVERYNATEVYGWAAGLSSFREVGPLLLGLVLASRVGSRNTAELATLLAKERLDALTALGLDTGRVVVLPRLVAIACGTVLVFPLAAAVILLSAFVLAALVGGQLLAISWYSFTEYLEPSAIAGGVLRMALFGVLIAVSSCAFGLAGGQDARRIGRNVYASSVASMSGVVILNLYLTFLTGAS